MFEKRFFFFIVFYLSCVSLSPSALPPGCIQNYRFFKNLQIWILVFVIARLGHIQYTRLRSESTCPAWLCLTQYELQRNVSHTWILVWGLAWLGLTPSFALYLPLILFQIQASNITQMYLPWASLFPSPNFPSSAWWRHYKMEGSCCQRSHVWPSPPLSSSPTSSSPSPSPSPSPTSKVTWIFVLGLAWSDLEAPSFALNLC